MNFEAEKDIEGNYIPSTVKFSFSHPELNDDEIAAIQHTEEMINQIKLSVYDSNLIVSKETRGLSVKIYPAE